MSDASQLPATWRQLLSFVPPKAARDNSVGHKTAAYDCLTVPAANSRLQLSVPATGTDIPERAIRGLYAHLAANEMLDVPLGANIQLAIASIDAQSERTVISAERDFFMQDKMSFVVSQCVKELTVQYIFQVLENPQEHSHWLRWGSWSVNTFPEDPTLPPVRAWVADCDLPSVIRHYRAQLCDHAHGYTVGSCPGDDARAMLYKLYLHMQEGTHDHAMIYSGNTVIFAERESTEHALRISRMYRCFLGGGHTDDASLPTIPLVAVMLAFSLPGVNVAEPDASDSASSNFAVPAPEAPRPSVYRALSESALLQSFVIVEYPERELQQTPEHDTSWCAGHAVLLALQFLHRGPVSLTWLVRDGEAADSKFYIAKIFPRSIAEQQSQREAAAVACVRERCGDVTPRLVGAYYCQRADADVLLLEHGGRELTDYLSMADREMVWEMVTALHAHDVLHGDVAPRNFVRGLDGKLRFIDFGFSDLTHKCPGPETCWELRDVRRDLELDSS